MSSLPTLTSYTQDLTDAIRCHIHQRYAGPEFLFSKDGRFHKRVNAHSRPVRTVTRWPAGYSIKAIQAQLGYQSAQSTHQYAHLGERAQLHLVQALSPSSPPSVNVRSTSTGGADGRTAQGAGTQTETGNAT